MVAVQIISTGQIFDIANEDLTYTKQVADLGDVTKQNASYSFNMRTPKTPENTMILEGLGIAGDTSNMPYIKVYVRLINDGIAIVDKGLLTVAETADDYKLHIQDGIIEFFKEVKDDKMGETLDLSELDHQNDIPTIIGSIISALPYKYVLADFNGSPLPNLNGITNLNSLTLVPSVNLRWLWDKVFAHYRWKYEAIADFNFDVLNDMWMSYPSPLGYNEETDVLVMAAEHDKADDRPHAADFTPDFTGFHELQNTLTIDRYWAFIGNVAWIAHLDAVDSSPNYASGSPDLSFGELVTEPVYNNRYYRIKKNGFYRINWSIKGMSSGGSQEGSEFRHVYGAFLIINKQFQWQYGWDNSGSFDVQGEESTGVMVSLKAGDLIAIGGIGHWNYKTVTQFSLSIYQAGVQDVDFAGALIKYKTKDFFKEVMMRFALTAFPDAVNRTIRFMTLDERISAPAIDWTDKYVKRQSEEYTYKNYAQNNYMRHKYDDDDQEFNDGNLTVDNQNLDIERDLWKSQTYSPEALMVPWNGSIEPTYYVPSFKLFELEVSRDDAGNLVGDYKPLKNRFFIFRATYTNEQIYIMDNLVEGFYKADFQGQSWKDIANSKFRRVGALLGETRIHKIELALGKYDVSTVDLSRTYFFEQENGYYILNKLTWKNGKTSVGEFVRVKRFT